MVHRYDLDMPVECDDEYWDGAFPFQQPAEQPSSVAFFTHHLKLQKILNMTLRTLVSYFLCIKNGQAWR